MDKEKMRTAGRIAGKMMADAGKDWAPVVKNSGEFVKHVVPAAVKPLHALWHQLLGFIFLLFAISAGFRIWKDRATASPLRLSIVALFAVVMAGYGLSSILKARRISRK